MTPILIETHTDHGAEWGVSINGPNPEAQDYIPCTDREFAGDVMAALDGQDEETARRLARRLNALRASRQP